MIILATGGTGGHVFPAIAVAETLSHRNIAHIFLIDSRTNQYLPSDSPKIVLPLNSSKYGFTAKAKFYYKMMISYFIAYYKMKDLKPNAVVGFGSYATFPTLLAAKHLAIPIILHEQNAILGKVNRIFLRTAKTLCVSYQRLCELEIKKNIVFTGNPVRKNALLPNKANNFLDKLHILILGGSQGASIFDNVLPQTIAQIRPELLADVHLVHQCRKGRQQHVAEQYTALHHVTYEVSDFFTDIGEKISSSHLIISRAGATTVAELTANHKPVIYVPYKLAADNHQMFNVERLKTEKAALVICENDFTSECLTSLLSHILLNRAILYEMARNTVSKMPKNASVAVVDAILAASKV